MKTKNLLKFRILLLGISLLLWNCEKEVEFNQITESNEHVIEAKVLSKNDIDPKIISFLNSKTKLADIRSKEANSNDYKALIDFENIKQVVDQLGNINYTFLLEVNDNDPTTFYNLIVNQNEEASEPNVYVHKFVSETSSLNNFIDSNYDFRHFKGKILKYNLSIFLSSHANQISQRIGGVDDCICDEISVTGDGSVSSFGDHGVSTGNDGGISGGGSEETSTSDDCATYTYVQGCSQSNTDRWHLHSSCGAPDQAQNFLSVVVCGGDPDTFLFRTNKEDDCNNPCGGTGSGGSVGIVLPNYSVKWDTFLMELPRGLREYVASSLTVQSGIRPFLNENNYSIQSISLVYTILTLNTNSNLTLQQKIEQFNQAYNDYDPLLPQQTSPTNYEAKIRHYINYFTRRGNHEFSNYLSSLLPLNDSFSNQDYQALYQTIRQQKINYLKQLLVEIGFATFDAFKPVIEMALMEVGGGLALKVLQKLPVRYLTTPIRNIITRLTSSSSVAFSNFKHAKKFGIQTYASLEAKFVELGITRTGLNTQFHHLIEQRFARSAAVRNWLGNSARNWKSVVLTPQEHQIFTNAWRQRIGYGTTNGTFNVNTSTATLDHIKRAAREIYADYPEILNALGL